MARARNIKPGFFKNEDLGKRTDAHCRLLFAGLWTLADKAGRLEDRPERIRGELFPYEPQLDIDGYLTVLSRLNFVIRYRIGKVSYIQVSTWNEHQRPHHTEKESEIPPYVEGVTPLTVNSPVCNGENPPDSLIHRFTTAKAVEGVSSVVLTENPSTSQVPPEHPRPNGYASIARGLLTFLNERAEKAFQPTDVNVDLIVARLREGYTESQCRQVIVRKVREWRGDEIMHKFLRPATLFGREKFNQYAGELVAEKVPT